MPVSQEARRNWLSSLVADKRSRISVLLGELAGLGAPAFMKPHRFQKFLALLAQISNERQKECELLERIENVESLHRYRRQQKMLEKANHAYKSEHSDDCENTRSHKGLWAFFHLWFRAGSEEKIQKEQTLNND